MKIGIGITTYNRPEYAEKCAKSLARLDVDGVYLVNDGSDPKHRGAYERAYKPIQRVNGSVYVGEQNRGVAAAKNALLQRMLVDGMDRLFLIEDDILITDPACLSAYVEAAEAAGLHHLSFAHHGPANLGGPVKVEGKVEFYPHSVGAFTMFTAECLNAVGLLDEHLHNAWEHVEHELRLIAGGWMPGADAYCYPDLADSAALLKEIPGSIERSSIRVRSDWAQSIREGLVYWKSTRPNTYAMLFGEGTPLEHYAQQVTGG